MLQSTSLEIIVITKLGHFSQELLPEGRNINTKSELLFSKCFLNWSLARTRLPFITRFQLQFFLQEPIRKKYRAHAMEWFTHAPQPRLVVGFHGSISPSAPGGRLLALREDAVLPTNGASSTKAHFFISVVHTCCSYKKSLLTWQSANLWFFNTSSPRKLSVFSDSRRSSCFRSSMRVPTTKKGYTVHPKIHTASSGN